MSVPALRRVLVGSVHDPHVAAVAARRLPCDGTVVVDAATVGTNLVRLDLQRVVLTDQSYAACGLPAGGTARGWLRRVAPPGWDEGAVLGGHRAAVLSSRLALLSAVLRDPGLAWLTSVEAVFHAESKIVQYRTARQLGLRVPSTIVSGDTGLLTAEVGEPFVLKPLGPGAYRDDAGGQRVVYSHTATSADLQGSDLLAAPFLAQRRLDAEWHLRVVTVRGRAWVARLDAQDRPLDWREQHEAHDQFVPTPEYPDVAAQALALAAALRCGYSSQDWIITTGEAFFVDLNPGGQWLFLPEPIASEVTTAIAAYLDLPAASLP